MPEFRRSRALVVGTALALMVGLFSVDYTVERGDTLGEIAKEHGVSVADLIKLNDISNPNLIYIGQVLVIPGEEGEPEVVHVVKQGDTLSRIASSYGSSVTALVERNGITNPNLIRIGQNIVISGSGTSGGSSTSTPAPSANPNVRSGAYHIVKKGEKLDAIAANHGVPSSQIAKANGILNGVVYVNTRLFLDGPEYVAKGTEGEFIYTVKNGDRLGDIAAANGTNISTLVSLNNISNPNLIRSGQELLIPSGQRWVCPVDNARFSNGWGFPRGGGARWHEGIDLFTTHGAPVYAPVSGTVEFKTGPLGGHQFNLDGDDGVEYIGSHMSEFGKSGKVHAGEIVGYVGNTGNAVGTSPHLHFGMYLEGGVVINPYPTLVEHGCKG